MKLLTALALLLAVTVSATGGATATSHEAQTTIASAGDPSQWS